MIEIRYRLVVAALAMGLGTAHALPDAQFQPAFDMFMQARTGHGSPEAAAKAFAGLHAQEPDNPVLLAYQGSATAMQARQTLLPWRKIGYAEDGLALIDKALALLTVQHDTPLQNGTPGTLEVKFVAANTFLAVPRFMNRQERGQKLLNEVLASPLLAQAPLAFRGSVWMAAADNAAKSGQSAKARDWLNQVVQAKAPQTPQAQSLLKELVP